MFYAYIWGFIWGSLNRDNGDTPIFNFFRRTTNLNSQLRLRAPPTSLLLHDPEYPDQKETLMLCKWLTRPNFTANLSVCREPIVFHSCVQKVSLTLAHVSILFPFVFVLLGTIHNDRFWEIINLLPTNIVSLHMFDLI